MTHAFIYYIYGCQIESKGKLMVKLAERHVPTATPMLLIRRCF